MQSYWSSLTKHRLNRRRALAASGGGIAAAVLLAACGGGSGDSGSQANKSSLVVKTEDSVKQAKRGGTLKDRLLGDVPSMDVQQPIAPLNTPAKHVYSTLVRQKAPHLQEPSTFEMSPDLAESWETSPDGLQITMKLRQNDK